MHTETDGGYMCIMFSNVANREELNHEVDDILPVVLALLVSFPYAAGAVHHQYDVYLTCCIIHVTAILYIRCFAHFDSTSAMPIHSFV